MPPSQTQWDPDYAWRCPGPGSLVTVQRSTGGGPDSSLNQEKVAGCSPGQEAGCGCSLMDAGLGLARPLKSIALLAEMCVTREKAP